MCAAQEAAGWPFPERGGSAEADEGHSSLPGSSLLAGGSPSKSKEPSFPGAQHDKNN